MKKKWKRALGFASTVLSIRYVCSIFFTYPTALRTAKVLLQPADVAVCVAAGEWNNHHPSIHLISACRLLHPNESNHVIIRSSIILHILSMSTDHSLISSLCPSARATMVVVP